MNRYLFGYTLRQTFLQPVFLFLAIVICLFIGLFSFQVSFVVERGQIIAITLFGKDLGDPEILSNMLLPNAINFLQQVSLFIIIIGCAPLFVSLLYDPLLHILLTKTLSRRTIFITNAAGIATTICMIIGGATAIFFIIFALKIGHFLTLSIFFGVIPFFIAVLVLVSLASLFGMLLKNQMGVTMILILFYLLSSFIFSNFSKLFPFPLSYLQYAFVDFDLLHETSTQAFLVMKSEKSNLLFIPLFQSLMYFSFALYLFNSEELA